MVFSMNESGSPCAMKMKKAATSCSGTDRTRKDISLGAEDLLNSYQMNGKPVAEWAVNIRIEDYTGFDA